VPAAGLHHRRRLGDTDINEVIDTSRNGRGDGLGRRSQVNGDELRGSCRRWVRDAEQLQKGISASDRVRKGRTVEWVADHDLRTGGALPSEPRRTGRRTR
jgi:hypothetical protein